MEGKLNIRVDRHYAVLHVDAALKVLLYYLHVDCHNETNGWIVIHFNNNRNLSQSDIYIYLTAAKHSGQKTM